MSGGASVAGMDQRDSIPPGSNCDGNGNFSAAQAVNMPQTQDNGTCCPANQPLEDAYLFMHEGLPMVYSDGYNHNFAGGTPIVQLRQLSGRIRRQHHAGHLLSAQPTRARRHLAALERPKHRRRSSAMIIARATSSQPRTQDVALFAMNDNFGYPGDITFDDGVSERATVIIWRDHTPFRQRSPNARMQGLVVGFPPGSVLVQLASSRTPADRAYHTIAGAWRDQSLTSAKSTAMPADPRSG